MGPMGQMGRIGLIGPMGLIRPIVLALMLVLLTACGGGGSESISGGEVVPPPPVNPEQGGGDTPYSAGPAMAFSGAFADSNGQKSANAPRRAMRRAAGDPQPGDGEFTTDSLQASGFGVYCWYTGSDKYTSGGSIKSVTKNILMLNQQVIYSGGRWTYSPTKYWPLNANEMLTLRAYAPYVSYQLQMDANGMPSVPVVVTKDDYHNGTQHDPLWGTGKLVKPIDDPDGEYDPIPTDEEEVKAYYRYGTLYDNITYKMSGDWRDKPTDHDPADTRNGTIDWYFHHGMSKLIFKCIIIKDAGCDKVTIKSLKIENLAEQGRLSLSSKTETAEQKPTWYDRSGSMTVNLTEHTPNTQAGDLAPAPPQNKNPYVEYPYVIDITTPSEPTGPFDLLSKGLLIIPRDFSSGDPMRISIDYTINNEADVHTATTTITSNFQGNTNYTLNLNLTPSTKGLEITMVQSAFTPWQYTVEGYHKVFNW